MVLSAILKMDAGAFTTPMGKALEGVKGLVRIAGDVGEKLQQAFDTGGMLSDLQAQTGELPGTLMVLRQAFQDTGVGADGLGQTLAIMRKSLGGISEDGQPTGKMFKQLGLNIAELQGMGAQEQLQAIGGAISTLKSPAEQTAAAMGVFGRSGAKMLTFLKDPAAIGTAQKSLGGLPDLMSRNAAAFDTVSDRIGRIKQKGDGLWAGIAEGLAPLADSVTASLDGVDLTGLGQKIGLFAGVTMDGFAAMGQALGESLGSASDWWGEKMTGLADWLRGDFDTVGDALWDSFASGLSWFSAAMSKALEEIMELIGKIPLLGKKLGLDGFEAQSFDAIREQVEPEVRANVQLGRDFIQSTASEASKGWQEAMDAYKTKISALQKPAAATGAAAATGTLAAIKEAKSAKSSNSGTIPTDALARIGGYLGGGGKSVTLAERTANATERMAGFLERFQGAKAGWA